MPPVVIIGGGISGLSTAYYLSKGGAPSLILESRPRFGGVIQTEHVEGCTIEAGPDSFLSAKPAAMELIQDLGLGDMVIGSNDRDRITYVRKGGRLVPMPDGLMLMVPTKILPLLTTGLLGLRTKIRMGMELLRKPKPRSGDQSVAEFIQEHYGRETVDYLAEPLLAGIYGGSPEELSVASVLPRFVELANQYGSLTRGVMAMRAKSKASGPTPPLFRTLRNGLGAMIDAIAAAIADKSERRTGRAERIERTPGGFRVRVDGDWIESERLVVACEAHNAAPLLGAVDPRIGELLAAVPYRSSMTVALGYNAADFSRPPSGFGFLVPKKERRHLVACTWVGNKFSHRVPPDKVVARCFMGGCDADGVLDQSDETAIAAVAADLRDIAGVTAQHRFARVFRWPRSMAQYTVGHGRRTGEIEARLRAIPGLYLAGNAYQGIGIPDCIRMGRAAAEQILMPAR